MDKSETFHYENKQPLIARRDQSGIVIKRLDQSKTLNRKNGSIKKFLLREFPNQKDLTTLIYQSETLDYEHNLNTYDFKNTK